MTNPTQISPAQFNSCVLTHNFTNAQRQEFNKQSCTPKEMNDFIATLHKEGGIAKLAADIEVFENYRYYALKARLIGKPITNAQVATIHMLASAIIQMIRARNSIASYRDPETKRIHTFISTIFQGPVPKLNAHYLFDEDAKRKTKIEVYITRFFCFTSSGFIKFKNALMSAPLSEKYFFTIPIPLGPVHQWSPFYQEIVNASEVFRPVDDLDFNDKDISTPLKPQLFVAPSFSMFHTWFKIQNINPMQLVPVFGSCTSETDEVFKSKNCCAIEIGNKDITRSGTFAGKAISPLCDLYCGFRHNRVKNSENLALCRINQFLGEAIEKAPEKERKALVNLKLKLIDGQLHNSATGDDLFGSIFRMHDLGWSDASRTLILKDMAENLGLWRLGFGITSQSLLPEDQIGLSHLLQQNDNLYTIWRKKMLSSSDLVSSTLAKRVNAFSCRAFLEEEDKSVKAEAAKMAPVTLSNALSCENYNVYFAQWLALEIQNRSDLPTPYSITVSSTTGREYFISSHCAEASKEIFEVTIVHDFETGVRTFSIEWLEHLMKFLSADMRNPSIPLTSTWKRDFWDAQPDSLSKLVFILRQNGFIADIEVVQRFDGRIIYLAPCVSIRLPSSDEVLLEPLNPEFEQFSAQILLMERQKIAEEHAVARDSFLNNAINYVGSLFKQASAGRQKIEHLRSIESATKKQQGEPKAAIEEALKNIFDRLRSLASQCTDKSYDMLFNVFDLSETDRSTVVKELSAQGYHVRLDTQPYRFISNYTVENALDLIVTIGPGNT